jgi:hypothetical protein
VRSFKSKEVRSSYVVLQRRATLWKDVEILGITNVRETISKSIFSLEEKGCQFAGDAGAD